MAEKIRWEHIAFQDNAMCVALIEDSQVCQCHRSRARLLARKVDVFVQGLLSLLDDECQMQSSDEGFVTKAPPPFPLTLSFNTMYASL